MMGKGKGDCEDFRDGRNCFRAKQYGINRATEKARRACSDSETIHKKHNVIICPAPKSAVYFSLSREKASAK